MAFKPVTKPSPLCGGIGIFNTKYTPRSASLHGFWRQKGLIALTANRKKWLIGTGYVLANAMRIVDVKDEVQIWSNQAKNFEKGIMEKMI